MQTSKRISSTTVSLSLAMLALSAGLLSGCGSNDSGSAPEDQPDAQVNSLYFAGDVAHFAGKYNGTCTLQTSQRKYENCVTRVVVKQSDSQLIVSTWFALIPSASHQIQNTNSTIKGQSLDKIKISGKILTNDQNEAGTIGELGFGYRRISTDFTFARTAPITYTYSGSFVDDSGRTVQVSGIVKR